MTRSGGGQPTAHEAKHRVGDLVGREATPRAIPLDERVDEAEREAFCQTGVEVGAQASFGKRKLEELPQLGVKGAPWTAGTHLPGGDFAPQAFDEELARLRSRYPFLSDRHAERLLRAYGRDAVRMLADARDEQALGRHFGGTLYEIEVRWLIEREWAGSAEDILWRRTKQGLFLSPEEAAELADYLEGLSSRLKAG